MNAHDRAHRAISRLGGVLSELRYAHKSKDGEEMLHELHAMIRKGSWTRMEKAALIGLVQIVSGVNMETRNARRLRDEKSADL